MRSPSSRRILFVALLVVAVALSLAAAMRYATPLDGLPGVDVQRMDTGWLVEEEGGTSSLPQLPCELDRTGDTLVLVHDLSGTAHRPGDVLALGTRYQSIRVWADERLVYEAAQGEAHALGSMWHFVPSDRYENASSLRVELKRYDQGPEWEIPSVIQDSPGAVGAYILKEHAPAILAWVCCMLFTLLLVLVVLFMAIRNVPGIPLVSALASFIFVSGTWVILDSKVTTIFGGNYALTYFLSYCSFYLLPIPLLVYFRLMTKSQGRFLRWLTWATAGNAVLWMLLHLLGVVSIRDTTYSVHAIIVAFVVAFVVESFRKGAGWRTRLRFVFWGMVLIFAAALVSIGLYHAGILPPANSAVVFAWSLLALIVCMTMDTIVLIGRVWEERRRVEVYRQLATEDSMTGLANRNAYELRVQELASNPPDRVCFVSFDIDGMKGINDGHGHNAGDRAISLVAHCIDDVFGNLGGCYRIGGDEFCVILDSDEGIVSRLRLFDEMVAGRNGDSFPVSVSHGWECRSFEGEGRTSIEAIEELKEASDRSLYRDKEDSRRR